MSRQDRIQSLAEENRSRTHMRKLRERFSAAVGYEVSDEQFVMVEPRTPPSNIGVPHSSRPEGLPTFQRFHEPGNFVENNHGLFEAFGRRVAAGKLLLQTNMWYSGVPGEEWFPWLEVDARVFLRILERSREWGALWFCVCDHRVENGFCLREGTNQGVDTEHAGYWTLEVFGEKWVPIAEELFKF